MKKIKLNLGCGIRAVKGWINVDKYLTEQGLKEHKGVYKNAVFEKGAKFVQADILKMPFPNNYADRVELHEVIEHMYFREVIPALKEIYRVTKKGGVLVLHCPNFDGLAVEWLHMIIERKFDPDKYVKIMETVVGNQIGGEGEIHKCLFNVDFLNFCLVSSGFTNGVIETHYKGAHMPKIGELGVVKKGRVLRNDTLVAYMTK